MRLDFNTHFTYVKVTDGLDLWTLGFIHLFHVDAVSITYEIANKIQQNKKMRVVKT